jgi:hypothetical protein
MILSEETSLTLVVTWRGFRVWSNPTLCGLLKGDVNTFVVLNFENKSCVSCALVALLSKFPFILLFS